MFRELEGQGRIVVADLEAGVGTLLRVQEDQVDLAFVVVQPSGKSMEVARRALAITASRNIPAVLAANRIGSDADLQLIRETLEPQVPVVVIPDDRDVGRADEEGVAPIDVAPDSPGVQAIVGLIDHLGLPGPARHR